MTNFYDAIVEAYALGIEQALEDYDLPKAVNLYRQLLAFEREFNVQTSTTDTANL